MTGEHNSRSSLPGERSTLELVLDELKLMRDILEERERTAQQREERWLAGQQRIAKALDTDLEAIRIEQRRLGSEHVQMRDRVDSLSDRVSALERKATGE